MLIDTINLKKKEKNQERFFKRINQSKWLLIYKNVIFNHYFQGVIYHFHYLKIYFALYYYFCSKMSIITSPTRRRFPFHWHGLTCCCLIHFSICWSLNICWLLNLWQLDRCSVNNLNFSRIYHQRPKTCQNTWTYFDWIFLKTNW